MMICLWFKLTYLQLGVTRFDDVSVHVNFVVVQLVVLDDETLESCVFVAIKLLKEVLGGCDHFFFINSHECFLVSELNP